MSSLCAACRWLSPPPPHNSWVGGRLALTLGWSAAPGRAGRAVVQVLCEPVMKQRSSKAHSIRRRLGRRLGSETFPWKLQGPAKGSGESHRSRLPGSSLAIVPAVGGDDIMKTREGGSGGHICCPSSVLVHTEQRSLGSRLAVQ